MGSHLDGLAYLCNTLLELKNMDTNTLFGLIEQSIEHLGLINDKGISFISEYGQDIYYDGTLLLEHYVEITDMNILSMAFYSKWVVIKEHPEEFSENERKWFLGAAHAMRLLSEDKDWRTDTVEDKHKNYVIILSDIGKSDANTETIQIFEMSDKGEVNLKRFDRNNVLLREDEAKIDEQLAHKLYRKLSRSLSRYKEKFCEGSNWNVVIYDDEGYEQEYFGPMTGFKKYSEKIREAAKLENMFLFGDKEKS